jgi:predicted kinase
MPGSLIIIRGLPGSGKSTIAAQMCAMDPLNTWNVTRDNIREMQGLTFVPGISEHSIVQMRDSLIRAGLKAGHTVISSDTNLKASVVKDLLKIAAKYDADTEIVNHHPGLDICLRRDRMRGAAGGRLVGEKVILDMYHKFFKDDKFRQTEFSLERPVYAAAPYIPDFSKPEAFIVDIDGTVAHNCGHRGWYDYSLVANDTPHDDVIKLVQILAEKHEIIFCSGREDDCEKETRAWIEQHIPGVSFELYMRQAGDKRQDGIVKLELFDWHIRNRFNVLGVFDDRNQVVDAWRSIGLRVYQVAPGEF